MADPIFIAPHYDDVALSCGALVALLSSNASPIIVTVFAGVPKDADFSEFAQQMHTEWGLTGEQAVDARRAEDRCATETLGSSIRAIWLDWLDAIYRDHRYASDRQLFGEVLETDRDLPSEIADVIDQQDEGEIYLPLGVGNHVDHQIVYNVGKELASRGRTVFGYADLPYALVDGSLRQRLESLGNPQSLEIAVSRSDFARQWNAIQCYRSQIPFILRDITNPRSRFEKFMARGFGKGHVERLWIIDSDT